MDRVIVDCRGVKSLQEFWQRYLDAVNPSGREHFGCNLDAFWEAVEEDGLGSPGQVNLVFRHSEDLRDFRSAGGRSFLRGLRDIASQVTRISITLT